MKIIVPMAGQGKRMRPHTLTVPKPLIPIAGKPIVQRLVEDIAEICGEKIEEVAYIIGDFGKETENTLLNIAESIGAKGTICYQNEALGTAHAVLCAKQALEGEVIIAFADTLFRAKFDFDRNKDGMIWVHSVEDPRAFGVVKLNDNGVITDFIEKPQHFVSDLAIIGIYYFKDGNNLKNELQYLIDNDIKEKGEYQLTNALENMKAKGLQFVPGRVEEWLDCGNKNATVYTNQRVLINNAQNVKIADNRFASDVKIIEPCFIAEGVQLSNCEIGPYVSIGANAKITNSKISNSIIQTHSSIKNITFTNSMIGNHTEINGEIKEFSLGDYCVIG
ncbi:MAG: nucleotidyltransferase [Bacteroidetes bacterium]|nr:nucleotidyltransferase [Bacteroidota bacterium]